MEVIILLIAFAVFYFLFIKPLKTTTESSSQSVTPTYSVNTSSQNINLIPEDSTLRRHYCSHLEYQKLAITNPYPTDSALRRHHETQIASLLPSAEKVEVKAPKKTARKPRTTTKPAAAPKKAPKSTVSSGASKTKKK